MNRSFFKAIYLIAGMNWLTGCSLSPSQHPAPPINVPEQWQMGDVSLIDGKNLPYLAWWKKFQDPELNHLIETGLQVNNTVQQARAKLLVAKEELRSVQLSWLPSLNILAGYSLNPAFGVPGGFYGVYPGYFTFNALMTIARQKSAKIGIEARQYALQSTKLVFIGQIAEAYFIYIAEIERLRLFEQYLKDLQELLSIQKDNYRGGIESLLPFASLKQITEEAGAQKEVIKDNIIKAQNALRYLLNENPGGLRVNKHFGRMQTTYPTFGTLPATVLANRPDIAFAESQYRLAVQQISVERATLLPTIQLDELLGGAARSRKHNLDHFSQLFTDAYATWSINPAVFGEISALRGEAKAAYYSYVDTVRKALRDVANDFSAHQTANARYLDLKRSNRAAEERYHLDNALYKQGIQPYEIVLKDRIDLAQVALAINAIKLTQMISLVNLYQDLGGGYCHQQDNQTT